MPAICFSPHRDQPIRRLRCALRSEEHTSELQSHLNLVCRLLLEKKNSRPNGSLSALQVAGKCCICPEQAAPLSTHRDSTTTRQTIQDSCGVQNSPRRKLPYTGT